MWAVSSPVFKALAVIGESVYGVTEHVTAAICSAPVLGLMCPASGNLTLAWTVCKIPLFNAFCMSTALSVFVPRTDYPWLIDIQTRNLVPLLDETIHGPGLLLEIKKAEMAAIDISSSIRHSALPSRTSFADHLLEFHKEAREAQDRLQRFSSHLNSALERVLNINDYALHAIRRACSCNCHTWPFSWFGWCKPNIEEVVSRTFALALEVVVQSMEHLVYEAQSNFDNIGRLEECLNAIAQLHASESIFISSMMATLQDDFWTRLGLNGAAVRGVNGLQDLLTAVGQSHQHAHAHVVAVLQTLHGMSADMEELRERLHVPELIGDTIPIDVQIESLMKGIERLKARRIVVVETVLTLSGEN
ncbi:hypothetical protein EWM64_g6491 [Hericium alpestre]|uniref:Uncharacterized protein n=1 Tax=Hericium alpestre TaxID=135208 RepID=A0A4Y9ZUK8_9AGAM|nr:hypothetical protein EWM64_g6491 [Hericium alpestre]